MRWYDAARRAWGAGTFLRGFAAAVVLVWSLAGAGAASAQTSPTVQFQSTYRSFNGWDEWKWWQPDKCTQTQPLYGSEPAVAGRYPVVVYLHGTLADWGGNEEGRRVVQLAAAHGFVGGAITYDSWLTSSAGNVDGNARCMFSSGSAGNPLAQLCARAKADCSKGVVVAGFSAGGAIAARAANFAAQVRAAWLMGVNGPAIAPALAGPAGTRTLPDDRIRITVGRSEVGTDVTALNKLTGMSCSSSPCLRGDGSGYYVVQDSEVADGVADHCYWQSVNLFVPSNSCTWTPTFDPGFRPPSTTPWSLIANLDWLLSKLG